MKKNILLSAILFIAVSGFAQLRPGDKSGINVFETPKSNEEFDHLKVELGGGFTAGFQALRQSSDADQSVDPNQPGISLKLMDLTNGLTNPFANLNIKGYLSDGITLNIEMYLSSRHHSETWVKGGFVQIDKVPFLKNDLFDMIMNFTTIKIGQLDVNYGDAHFRRSDGGNTIQNPFVENYILDAFATEMGVEADVKVNSLLMSVSVTDGLLDPELTKLVVADNSQSNGTRNASFIMKLGYDNQFTKDFRFRLTGSVYTTKGSGANTLYGGDRTGSKYFGVMDPFYAADGTVNKTSANTPFTSGRFNPGYGDNVTAFMGNLLLKYKGLESFSTLESSSGRGLNEVGDRRKTMQFATDLIYRFGGGEQFYVAGRYNTVKSTPQGFTDNININRLAFAFGWFPTKNLLAKLEYVNQDYKNYPSTSIYTGGNFHGLVLSTAIGF